MQFRSINNANAANYITAGKGATQGFLNITGAIKKNAPDFTGIINQIRKNKGKVEREKIIGLGNLLSTVAKNDADVYVTDINERLKTERNLRQAKAKMAGGLAAIGKESIGDYLELTRKDIPKPPPTKIVAPVKPDLTEYGAITSEQVEELTNILKGTQPAAPTTPAPANVAPASATSAVPSGVPSGSAINSLARIRDLESGGHGYYNAFNLGGEAGGTIPIGSGDSSVNSPFGVPATQLSLDQIHELHRTGKVHAIGAYQFTGAGGLREAQQQLGLPGSTIYTPEVQDMLANAYARTHVNTLRNKWIGLGKVSDAELAEIRAGFL